MGNGKWWRLKRIGRVHERDRRKRNGAERWRGRPGTKPSLADRCYIGGETRCTRARNAFQRRREWERGTGVRSRKHISRTHPSPGARCTRNDRNSPRRTCDPEVSLLATIYCHDTKRAPPLVCCSNARILSLSLSLSRVSCKMIRKRTFRFIFPIFESIFIYFFFFV